MNFGCYDKHRKVVYTMTIRFISNCLIIIGIIWCISGYFTYMQTIKINNIIHELSPLSPRLYSGKNAGFMRTRRIIFVAANDNGTIVEARVLSTAFIFKPARIGTLDMLKGKNIFKLDPASYGFKPVLEKALANTVQDAYKKNK